MAIEDVLYPLAHRYIDAPGWLKASAGQAYSWIPRRARLGEAYCRFRAELCATRTPQAAAALAREKLRATLQWAMETVPAYRSYRLFARTDDPVRLLSRMPITDKLDIKRSPEMYLSRAMPGSQRLRMVTGGTSRNPLEFWLQKHVTRAKEACFIEDFRRRVGAQPGELTLSLRGRNVPDASRPGGKLWTREPIKAQLIFSPNHLAERHMPRFAEALVRYRPRFVEAFPSMLLPLARWLAKNPLPEFTRAVAGVMLYSENVHGLQMELFRKVFSCPVLKHYGHSERVLMAASMPDDDRYFFWPQYGWFELVDFDDQPIRRPGVLGQIIGTSFDNRIMPFVRYRTGDTAVLCGSEHSSLRGYPVCERIEGRLQEFLVDASQRLVSLSRIGAAHLPAFSEVDSLQYEQSRPGELLLKYVASPSFSSEAQQRMASTVARTTGCTVRLARVQNIERTPAGKQCMLIQRLDIRRYLGRTALVEDAHASL